eukprot:Gb_36782 [translate_table: standard]
MSSWSMARQISLVFFTVAQTDDSGSGYRVDILKIVVSRVWNDYTVKWVLSMLIPPIWMSSWCRQLDPVAASFKALTIGIKLKPCRLDWGGLDFGQCPLFSPPIFWAGLIKANPRLEALVKVRHMSIVLDIKCANKCQKQGMVIVPKSCVGAEGELWKKFGRTLANILDSNTL